MRYLLLFHQILRKSAMVYVSNIDKNDIAEIVRNFNLMKETDLKLRNILLEENVPLEDKYGII